MKSIVRTLLIAAMILFGTVPLMADDVDIGLRIGKEEVGRFSLDEGGDKEAWIVGAIAAAGIAVGAGLYFGLRERRPRHA